MPGSVGLARGIARAGFVVTVSSETGRFNSPDSRTRFVVVSCMGVLWE